MDMLQGTWVPVSYEREGKKLDEKEFKDLRLMVEGHHFTYSRVGQKEMLKGTFKINPTQKPKTIDMTYDPEPGWEEWKISLFGIYELDGDTLKLYVGKKRPTAFKTTSESKGGLVTYRKRKP
jgi:uncharacterized protein (TIGR03067 family)